MHILLVDDESHMLDLLGSQLRRIQGTPGFKHFEIHKERTGKAAIEYHKSHKIDIAFLDIRLGDMSGLEVLRTMKKNNGKTFFCIVSGAGTADNVKESLKAGAAGFIVKPYKSEKIISVLEKFKKQQIKK